MRLSGLALAAILSLAAIADAQQAPPQLPTTRAPAVASTPPDPVLDGYLQRWEQEMKKYQTLALRLSRVDEDKTLKSVTKYNGIAYFMKAGAGPTARNLVLLELAADGSKEIAEKFVCTGTYFYLFRPGAKEIQAVEMPKPGPGAMPDDNFLGMFGIKADEAKRRYHLKLLKEDQDYIYIGIEPRFERDKADFLEARVVLYKATSLPVQLWYRQPNRSEVAWTIPPATVQLNARMNLRWFDKPDTPPGWKFVKVPADADAPPKLYRNSGAP